MRFSQEKTWKDFVQNTDRKKIWKVKEYLSGAVSQTVIPTLDGKAGTYEEMSDCLRRSFFPPPPAADLKDIRQATYPQEVQYRPNINIQQIRTAITKTAPNKAPGPDGIPNKVLKQALPHIETWLQRILQASLDIGHFPKAFKETTTVVLRKPSKPDYSKSKAYRPIALENTIGKIFESVIAEVISYLTETNELLPAHHYGGRPGRSVEDAMMALSESIHKAWKEKKIYSAVFLDVAGAFNNVHHKRLIHNLKMRRIPVCLARWLESFLHGRSTKLQFNGRTSDPIKTAAGVPQGSPLSPLLYMYYNADLLTVSTKPNEIAIGFIDDIVYGTAGATDNGNARRLKQMLKEAGKWRKCHGAQFEQSKYILVHFTRNYRKSTKASLTVDGTKINPADEAKYLGVIFDKALRFKAHTQYATKKGTSAALALGSIGKASWGAPYAHIKQLFQATVASRLDYAAIVWHRPQSNGAMAASIQVRKFTTVQRIAMKAILGCYRTTPTIAMEVESGLQPAWIRLQTRVLSALTRMQSLPPNHPIWTWLNPSIHRTKTPKKKIPHCSNFENLAREFPSLLESAIEEVKPFKHPPWAEEPAQQPASSRTQKTTKQAQREHIKRLAKTTWNKTWNRENPNTAIHLRRISGKAGTKEGPELYNGLKSRAESALLAQLRTGHCGLNYYLWRFKKEDSAECMSCGYEKETVEHFLTECPSFWEERRELRKKVGEGRMRIATLLGEHKAIGATMEFIMKTKRFKKQAE